MTPSLFSCQANYLFLFWSPSVAFCDELSRWNFVGALTSSHYYSWLLWLLLSSKILVYFPFQIIFLPYFHATIVYVFYNVPFPISSMHCIFPFDGSPKISLAVITNHYFELDVAVRATERTRCSSSSSCFFSFVTVREKKRTWVSKTENWNNT